MKKLGAGLNRGEEPLAVLDEDSNDLVTELDVHNRGHSLLSRPQQAGAKHYAEVRGRHQVLVTFHRDLVQMTNEHLEDLSVGSGQLLGDEVDLIEPGSLVLLLDRL